MAKIGDKLKISGDFHLKVFENGKLVKEYRDKNLVVNGGLNYLAKLITGDTVSPLTQIGVSTGTSTPGPTNSALSGTPFFKVFDSMSFLATGSVVINWSIHPSEANGITITEFGLVFADNTLFARKIGISVAKNASTSIVGTWKINITA